MAGPVGTVALAMVQLGEKWLTGSRLLSRHAAAGIPGLPRLVGGPDRPCRVRQVRPQVEEAGQFR